MCVEVRNGLSARWRQWPFTSNKALMCGFTRMTGSYSLLVWQTRVTVCQLYLQYIPGYPNGWFLNYLFVCMVFFVWLFVVFRLTPNFNSTGDITITGEGLQILTYMYTRHSWQLSSDNSLLCMYRDIRLYGYLWRPVTLTSVAQR